MIQNIEAKKQLRADKIPEILVIGQIDYGENFVLNCDNEGITCELSILCDKDSWTQNTLTEKENQNESQFQKTTNKLLSSLKNKNQNNMETAMKKNNNFSILQFFDSHENFARYSR